MWTTFFDVYNAKNIYDLRSEEKYSAWKDEKTPIISNGGFLATPKAHKV